MDFEKFHREASRLRSFCNSMECPDCGGLHQVYFRALPSGEVTEPVFERGIFGAPYIGYIFFVKDRIRALQSRYQSGE